MSGYYGAVAAAVLYAIGLLLLLVVRSRRHKIATGSSGFHGFTKTPHLAARVAGICFAVAVLLGLLAPILAASQLAQHHHSRSEEWPTAAIWVGLVLTGAGFATAVVAQNTMGSSWRIGVDSAEKTELVTSGVFSRTRNPIFTAMIAAQAGTALMAPTWLALVGVLLLTAGIELQVRLVEEPYLTRVHGNSYRTYAARAGRFLPGLGRLTNAPARARQEPVS